MEGRDHTDAAKACEALLKQVKDWARKINLDTTVHKNTQGGSNPMEV